jgi:anti-sigma B factor antagonist
MTKENLQVVATPGAREGSRILELKGALTIQTVFGFQDAVRGETAPELILDLSSVPFIDSAGLGALVATYVRAKKALRKIAFAGMNTQVKALADMTQLSQLFHTYPTVKDAEAALAQMVG